MNPKCATIHKVTELKLHKVSFVFTCKYFLESEIKWPTVLILSLEVLVTLTTDVGKILASLHKVQSKGDIKFLTAVKIAHVSIINYFVLIFNK